MSKRFISLVLLGVFLVQTTGCHSWRSHPPEAISEPGILDSRPVHLKLTSGEEIEMRNLVIDEEERTVSGHVVSINGVPKLPAQVVGADGVPRLTWRPMEFAIEDIVEFSVREFSGTKTFFAVVGVPAITLGALLLLVALTKESCPFLYVEQRTGSSFEASSTAEPSSPKSSVPTS